MNRYTLFLIVLFIFVPSAIRTQGQTDTELSTNKNTSALTISVTSLDINDEALNLVYEIRNDSEDDAWILVGGGKYRKKFNTGMAAGMSISEDGSTLTISARLNVSETTTNYMPISEVPIYIRLVRLYPGESQTEYFSIRIPIYLSPYTEHAKRGEQGTQYATRLSIKFGYYSGNLPERIFKKLKLPENDFPKGPDYPTTPDTFSMWNELLTSREDELLVPVFFHEIKGESEHTLSTVIENLSIPYMEKIYHPSRIDPPDLTSCVKVELQYRPPMLEYFFPYVSQKSLLSPDEMGYLQSDNNLVLENKQEIQIFANDILRTKTAKTIIGADSIRYRSYVDVTCHYDSKSSLTFPIYDDHTILIEGEEFSGSEGFPSLKILTPRIRSIDLRMRCAANLKNLWYCFRFYNQGEALRRNDLSIRSQTLYPTSNVWCDDILRPYPALGGFATIHRDNKDLLVCPSAGEGKNHYAMNPNCKPDSPADMVLLFETTDGWNQHGGPELFTFDNHNPKGGCVLLNGGTVKFIRTKEELQQLKWK